MYEDDYTSRERTPGKNLRSPRTVSGRPTVRKARRSASYSNSHGKLSSMETRPVSYQASMREEAQQPYLGEASPTRKMIMDSTSQPFSHDMSPHNPTETGAGTHSLSGYPQGLELTDNGLNSARKSDASASSLQNLTEPLWVEIPPPREEPNEDEFLLDDLTNLNFGPILASQHGLNTQFQREDELDVDDHTSVETMLPLDVLPMPPEFGTNVVV